ncbi:hypothetical protein DsansV1_C13g0122871 [Dioscorea sansibarensis]
MSHRSPPPIAVEIPSDDDCSPFPPPRKKRLGNGPLPAVLVIADDPTPQKPSSTRTPSFVAETPIQSDPALESSVSIVKCSLPRAQKLSGISNLICLESDNESEGFSEKRNQTESEKEATSFALEENFEVGVSYCRSVSPLRRCSREDSVGPCFSDKQASLGSNGKCNTKSIGNSEIGHFGRNSKLECSVAGISWRLTVMVLHTVIFQLKAFLLQ